MRVLRLGVAIGLALLAGVALAQGSLADIDLSRFFDWGDDPLVAGGGIAALVAVARASGRFDVIDGKVGVAIAVAITGLLAGVAIFIIDHVTVEPYASYGVVGAAAYGAVAGLQFYLGINLGELILRLFGSAFQKGRVEGGVRAEADLMTSADPMVRSAALRNAAKGD